MPCCKAFQFLRQRVAAAMERLFGWLTGNRLEEEEEREKDTSSISSRERELRPLTDGEVTTYGSNGARGEVGEGRTGVGRDEEDFVIIASEGEESKECSCTLEGSQEAAKVSTTTAAGGILKTAQDRLSPVPSCPHHRAPAIEWRSRADLPVRMKGLQAALHRGKVFVGGGYTGHANSEMTVYEYDPNFDLWAELPVSPMRWFGMTEYKGQLLLVGGKDMEKGRGMRMTNRIAVLNDDESCWLHPYPPMSAARAHPVVFCHAHLLVVAGGRKGVLDYNVEVFDGHHWVSASPPPVPISSLSSLVHCGHWYLVGGTKVSTIHYVSLQSYLHSLIQPPQEEEEERKEEEEERKEEEEEEEEERKEEEEERNEEGQVSSTKRSTSNSTPHIKWEEFVAPPFLVSRIVSVGHHLALFPSSPSDEGGLQVYLWHEEDWLSAGTIPRVSVSASVILLPRGDLLLLGGDVDGLHYSNKVYRVSHGTGGPQRKRAKKNLGFVPQ